MISTQKLQGHAYYWPKYLRSQRSLQGKLKIKTWIKLKSHMDVRFNLNLLIGEEFLEEKPIVFQEKR